MQILETIQPAVFLLVLLAAVALGTRFLGGFMLGLDDKAGDEQPTAPMQIIPEPPQHLH